MGIDWLQNGLHSAGKSGSSDVEVHVLEGYGHLDVLVSEPAEQAVFEPLLDWIERQLSPPA